MRTIRELWPGGLLYGGDAFGADSLALADFASRVNARRCCDLGCGSGILTLLLLHGDPALYAEAVEIRPGAAAECVHNAKINGLADRCRVITADLRSHGLDPESMDLVVCNPPYFPAGSGRRSPDEERAVMRTESATLEETCTVAAALLRPGGSFCLVHRTERMREVFAALSAAGLEPKRLRLFASRASAVPPLFLCEAIRGASPGLTAEPTLLQFGEDGAETVEYRKICHWEG